MKMIRASYALMVILSILAVGSALAGAYLGTLGSLVGLTTILTITVLGGTVELREWLPSGRPRQYARKGPLDWAGTTVHEAARGSYYFRRQIAEIIVSGAAVRYGYPRPSRDELAQVKANLLAGSGTGLEEVISPSPLSRLRGEAYVSRLGRAMELVENI